MSQIKFSGSCLCGAVKYEVEGKVERFSHCHCERCRKATGTGHASNVLVSPLSSLKWLSGESLLARYEMPEAKRFYTCFCSQCGSPMPRVIEQLDAVLVPAGSVDGDLPTLPQHRIFWESRADWSCQDDKLPVFSEYPE
jgi:hypothetical protein